MIGLTSLWINGRSAVTPELDPRRAQFVLCRIDEILNWEKAKEKEGDVRFVELGEYLRGTVKAILEIGEIEFV